MIVFAIAFAWVESAVVVYLPEIFFDGDFKFPLFVKWVDGKHIIDPLVRIEFGRETATIIMLVAVGWVAGRNRFQKFCFFMIVFGIWDIFYYVWLYVMVRWPQSLMTWDLLFFVPLPWVGQDNCFKICRSWDYFKRDYILLKRSFWGSKRVV